MTLESTQTIYNCYRGRIQGGSLVMCVFKSVAFVLFFQMSDHKRCRANALVGRYHPRTTNIMPARRTSSRRSTSRIFAFHRDANSSLGRPLLQIITPDGCGSSSSTHELIHNVKCAIAGGVTLVQLRDNTSGADSKRRVARLLRDATLGSALFVINGNVSEARSCGADGVHLPERMINLITELRDPDAWPRVVGCSVHSVEAAVRAARLGADYIQVGTMFATRSHPGKEPEGVGLLSAVRRQLQEESLEHVLILGVGGINATNFGRVAEAGADGVAAIRCLCEASDAEKEARRMTEELRRWMPAEVTPPLES